MSKANLLRLAMASGDHPGNCHKVLKLFIIYNYVSYYKKKNDNIYLNNCYGCM